jgi:BASS family bile acid:Na+ symporter
MSEVIRTISSTSVLVFAVASMISTGLSFSVRDVVAPLREPTRVLRAVVANFVLVPLLAAGLARALALAPAEATGLVVLGAGAGAPFVIRLIAIAAGDLALGTSLLVLLVPLTVIAMPIIVPLLAPQAAASPGAIAPPLALTLILPLAIGLLVSERAPRLTRRLQAVARPLSTIALVVLLASTLALNVRELAHILASRAIVAIVALVAGSFLIGVAMASPRRERRIVLGFGTAQRNIAAATVVAVEDIRDRDTLVLVVVASLIDLFVLIPLAGWLRPPRRSEPTSTSVESIHAT